MPARRTYQQGGWIDFKAYAADSCPSVLGVNSKSGMLKADSLILIGRCDLAYIAVAGAAGPKHESSRSTEVTNRSNKN